MRNSRENILIQFNCITDFTSLDYRDSGNAVRNIILKFSKINE